MVLLSSLLWWELGTRLPGPGPGEWLRSDVSPVNNSDLRGRPRLVLVNRLEGLSLPRNSAIINWPARHDLVVEWSVKLPTQTNKQTILI